VTKALISIGKEEIQAMIEEGETVNLNCSFCNTDYPFTVEELKRIAKEAK
jgi:molecular chaperone Hsp33